MIEGHQFSQGEIILNDLLRGRYQKERLIGKSEMNSKTLKFLKDAMAKTLDLYSGIMWLDVGCGDGRCLEILDALTDLRMAKGEKTINYFAIDISDEYRDTIHQLIKKYNITGEFNVKNGRYLKTNSKFDIISIILTIHEIDVIDLPYLIKHMLKLLKKNGILIISDFNDPYEREKGIIVWKGVEIHNMINYSGGLVTDMELTPSERIPSVQFFNISAKRFHYERSQFTQFMKDYDKILNLKIQDLIHEYHSIEEYLIKRIYEINGKKIKNIKDLNLTDKEKIVEKFTDDDWLLYERKELIKDQILTLSEKIPIKK